MPPHSEYARNRRHVDAEPSIDDRGARIDDRGARIAVPAPSIAPQPHRRLYAQLNAAVRQPNPAAVLVCAPAGTGKTVLLADWISHRLDGATVAVWVTVTHQADDQAEFWTIVRDAVETALPGPVSIPLPPAPGSGPQSGHPEILAAELARRPHPIALVFDDAHLLRDPLVLAEVVRFVELVRDSAPNLTVIFAARHEPTLPWHTYAAAGVLARIGWEDLALDAAQITAVLAEHDSVLPADDAAALRELTHGWAALIRIAAIYLHTHHDRHGAVADLVRSPHPISDHLVGEMLAALPDDLLRFLLATSVVDAFTADLAEHLTGPDAAATLVMLDRVGLPLLHVGDTEGTGRWHTCHPFLRAHLRAELHRTDPDLEARLHVSAADWYLADGSPVDALTHLVAVHDERGIADLLHRHGLAVVLGRRCNELFALLDGPASTDTTVVRLLHAVAALERGSPSGARAFLDTLPASTADGTDLLVEQTLAAAVEVGIALAAGQCPSRAAVADLAALPATGYPELDSYRLNVRAVAAGIVDPRAAEELLIQAEFLADLARHRRLQLRCATLLAAGLGRAGDVTGMARKAEDAFELAVTHSMLDQPDSHTSAVLIALACYLQGVPLDDRCRRILGSDTSPDGGAGTPAPCRQSRLVLDLHALAAGSVEQAAPVSAIDLEALLDDAAGPSADTGLLPYFTAALIRTGHLTEAEHLVRRLQQDHDARADTLVCKAVVHYSRGHHSATRAALAPLLDTGTASYGTTVAAWWLDALAAHRLGQHDAMHRSAEHALILAEPQNLVRPFLDGGPATVELLAVLAHRRGTGTPFADRIRRALADTVARPSLTATEQVVLAHLPSGRTADEIGRDLHVSVNTVKTHLRNLYRKLDATSRGDAIAAAVRCGLL